MHKIIAANIIERIVKGDLVHVPAATTMFMYARDELRLRKMIKIKKPIVAIFLKHHDVWCQIFHKNTIWTVRENRVYKINQTKEN